MKDGFGFIGKRLFSEEGEKMKRMKRILAAVMTLTLMLSLFSVPMPAAGADGGFTVVNLQTNGEDYPIIDDTPTFSWQMESAERGKAQTAYAIEVRQGGTVIWNSEKQTGDLSVGIAYEGPALAPSTVYSWTVTVWDETGVSVTSDPAGFETGLGAGDAAWEGSQWIGEKAGEAVAETPENIHYVVEADLAVEDTAVGLIFNYLDNRNMLMWQISTATAGQVSLRPHKRADGSWTTLDTVAIDAPGVTNNGGKTDAMHMQIDVTQDIITTYINDVKVDERAADMGLQISQAPAGGHSGGNEGGYIDNFKLTDYTENAEGEVVYDFNFDDGTNPLSGNPQGDQQPTSVVDGRLHQAGNRWSLPEAALGTPEDAHYVVEADLAVEDTGVGLIFNYLDNRNMLMWQVNTATSGQVRLRPHKRVNGAWSVVNPVTINVPGVTNNGGKTDAMHMEIDVTQDTITTYINDVQVDQRAASSLELQISPSPAGGHSGAGEGGYIDNFKLTDYTDNAEGEVVYDFNFDDGLNPLSGDPHSNLGPAEIVDGRLYQTENRWSLPVDLVQSPFPSFRKAIQVEGEVEWARLYATALGAFDMYIDGGRVGEKTEDGMVYDELKPGYTTASKRIHYYTYDVTDALQEEGSHLVAAQLAKGWYGGLSGEVSKPLGLRAKLLIQYAGEEEPVVIGTDSSWKTDYPSGYMFAAIYDGETYNGNMDTSWREELSYDDSGWGQPAILTDWDGIIDPISGSRVRLREDLTRETYTVTVYDGATGATDQQYGKINVVGEYTQDDDFTLQAGQTAVIDFGQNFAGWPEITASGPKDTVITMRTGEMLNDMDGLMSRGNDGPEGSVYHANYRSAASTSRYIMNGQGDETYHSTYTFYGFRYIELAATQDITVKGMRGLVLTSMLEDTGTLETSDADVNQLISNIKWGGYSNLLSIPTDCPQRNERSGWTADTQVFSTTGMYLADLENFYNKWMDDMRDSARESDGAFRTIAPINETEGYEAGWSDAGIIVPYNVYKMTGDTRILTENWDAMQKFMDVYMASTGKDGGGTRYGDWVALENNEEEVKRLCAIAYYAGDALMMAEMAEVLGKREDAEKYREVYEVEKAYFQEKYVNADGSLKRTEQTACLMALHYDLLPDENSREVVKAALLENLESHGNKLQTGFLGTAIIMQTLSDIGADDMAYNLLLQHEFPSWLYCVDLGATTTWERWNSYTLEDGFNYKRMNSNDPANMNSFNHYAYGAVGEWMYGYMAGIMYDMEQPGFQHIILQPTPDASGRMTYAAASYDSPYGRIQSGWEMEEGALSYTCTVPANTTATLCLPVEEGTVLYEGNVPMDQAEGVRYAGYEDGRAIYELASGRYAFGPQPQTPDPEVETVTAASEINFAVPGKSVQLTAEVIGSEGVDTAVVWTVTGGVSGTVIDENGLLYVAADETAETLTVTAAAAADESVTDSLTLPVRPLGDLTGDGKVDITDVMSACKVVARKAIQIQPSPEEILAGDLTEDKKMDITDIMSICRILARNAGA